jgi:hypothetical protein
MRRAAERPFPETSPTASPMRSRREREEVEVVAADASRRPANPHALERRECGRVLREEAPLDLLRDAELPFEKLLTRELLALERGFQRRHETRQEEEEDELLRPVPVGDRGMRVRPSGQVVGEEPRRGGEDRERDRGRAARRTRR